MQMDHLQVSLMIIGSPSLMTMSDQDLSAIYVYIRSLGPKGESAPAPLSP